MEHLLSILRMLGAEENKKKHVLYNLVSSIHQFAAANKDNELESAAWELMQKLKDADYPDLALLLRSRNLGKLLN